MYHGHIGFIGAVRERLEDDADHQIYLIQQRSWLGNVAGAENLVGGTVNCRICCAIPPWKAKSLEQLRLKATVQFVGTFF
jgi:hypothetical protein